MASLLRMYEQIPERSTDKMKKRWRNIISAYIQVGLYTHFLDFFYSALQADAAFKTERIESSN
jgi:hypothetical protein